MDKHIIRENAGKLWRVLITDVHRKLTLQDVKDATGFKDLEAASAIGWLAREDKIQFELEHHSTKDKNVFLYLMLIVYFYSLFKNIAPGGVFAGGFLHLHI